ncbi:pentapeptide repeat-containing protein [Lujinxingia vulgaris]|uniref:Pentapeptide repeat-containing protein n=1 Tax=Lujinxingia vulgaris TaxID=2600176 RepID=A0A5C6X8Z7_9DELT|nr:pentapeptide repeat-containing protein [Lujinxingia vulgaris]TXD35641.1 pentapeptide repeat-containing protein [Lujinxingia vulgaris]
MASGEPFVVYQHMSTCPSTPTMNAVLSLMELPDDLPLYIDHDFAVLDGRAPDAITTLPASSFVAFKDGDWIDLYPAMVSPVAQTMNHFLARNGLIAEGPTSPLIGPDAFTNADDLARGLTLGRVWSSLALPDHDLRGMRINDGAIAGSDFSGADLRKARFTNTLLSHTSFEGARTEGITLTNVTLRQVTCVDGSVRSGDVGDCLSE